MQGQQEAIDLSAQGSTPEQLVVAIGILLVLLVVTVVASIRARYAGLDDAEAEQKAAVASALRQQAPTTVRLDRETIREDPDHAVSLLTDGLAPGGGEASPPTIRDGVRSVGRTAVAGLEPVVGPIPGLSLRLLQFAGAAAVFGAVAVSTAAIETALRDGPAVGGGSGVGVGIVGAIPGVSEGGGLVLAAVLLVGRAAFDHWLVVTAVLVLAAVGVAVVERRGSPRTGPVRAVAKWTGRLALPLIAIWALLSLVRLPGIVRAWFAAPPLTKVLTIGVVVVGLGASAALIQQRAPSLARALRTTLGRQRVRAVAATTGAPLGTVVVAYIGVASITKSVAAGVVGAVVAGLIVRAGGRAAVRVAEGGTIADRGTRAPRQVVVDCYRLQSPAGTQLLCRVDGTTLGWPADREDARSYLVDRVLVAAHDRTNPDRRGEIRPLMPREYADALLDYGRADVGALRDRLAERVAEEIALAGDREIPADDLEDRLADQFPAVIWQESLHDFRRRGQARRRGDSYDIVRQPGAAD